MSKEADVFLRKQEYYDSEGKISIDDLSSIDITQVPILMQAYADKSVKEERERIVDGLYEKIFYIGRYPSEQDKLWNEAINEAIKIVKGESDE